MSIDFEADDLETAITDSLAALCRQHCPEDLVRSSDQSFPRELWDALAEFGLFCIATEDGVGGAVELFAAAGVLGEFAAPVPALIAASIFGCQILPEEEGAEIIGGEAVAALTLPSLIPWPDVAGILFECDGESAWLVEPEGALESISTLGAEPFATAEVRRSRELGSARRALAMHDLFVAGYLTGIADRLLIDTGAYVSARRQFGKYLSQFQGVSQPLGEAAIRVRAARSLGRMAAHQADCGNPDSSVIACARVSAEKAALQAIYTAHQSHGAMGVTEDGPVFYRSRRVRQLVSQRIGGQTADRAIEAAYLDPGLLAAEA